MKWMEELEKVETLRAEIKKKMHQSISKRGK